MREIQSAEKIFISLENLFKKSYRLQENDLGQSIRKGMLRLAGTVPGCVMALAMLGLAPQSRWAFWSTSSSLCFSGRAPTLERSKRAAASWWPFRRKSFASLGTRSPDGARRRSSGNATRKRFSRWEIWQAWDPVDLIPEKTREEMLERGSYWKRTFEKE